MTSQAFEAAVQRDIDAAVQLQRDIAAGAAPDYTTRCATRGAVLVDWELMEHEAVEPAVRR